MFLCAPQGLSGDVESGEAADQKQNHDTDGDTEIRTPIRMVVR